MLRRLACTAVLTLASLGALLLGSQATAGGPTSVLLTNPGGERATALYYTDERYSTLDELLHGTDTTRRVSADPPNGDGTYLTITWLAHDVSVWRTDQLVLDAAGSPWMSTQMPYGAGVSTQGRKWVSLKDSGAIVELVTSLGLLGGGQSAASVDTASEPLASTNTPSDVDVPGWLWIVPGILLGLGLSWAFIVWRIRTNVQPA